MKGRPRFARPTAPTAALFAFAALAAGSAIVEACSSDNFPNADLIVGADATRASDDAVAADSAAASVTPDASRDAATDGPTACPADVAKLYMLAQMSACGICTVRNCQSFRDDCILDCKCTDALLTLLACITVGSDVASCQDVLPKELTPAQLDEFIECNATCNVPCSSDTFFPDAGAGDDASDEATDANADAGDAVADADVPD